MRIRLMNVLAVAIVAAVVFLPAIASAQQGPAQLWAWGSGNLRAFDETGPLNTGTIEFTSTITDRVPEVEYTGTSWVLVETRNRPMEVWDADTKTMTLSVIPDYTASTIGANSITAMEMIGGTLYAAASAQNNNPNVGSEFGTLDPTTGVFTPIGQTGGDNPISGMAYDGTTLYAVTGGGPDSPLFSINMLTGMATEIGPLIVDGGGTSQFTDLEFGADGLLYAIDIGGSGSKLGTININTLDFTTIDTFTFNGFGTVTAITSSRIIPEPASLALLAFGGIILMRRSRSCV